MQARQLLQNRPARRQRAANARLGRSERLPNPRMGSRQQALRRRRPWWRICGCCCSSSPRCAATTRWALPNLRGRAHLERITVAAGRWLPIQPGHRLVPSVSQTAVTRAVLAAAQRRLLAHSIACRFRRSTAADGGGAGFVNLSAWSWRCCSCSWTPPAGRSPSSSGCVSKHIVCRTNADSRCGSHDAADGLSLNCTKLAAGGTLCAAFVPEAVPVASVGCLKAD
jgi:hypothetical protein